MREYDTSGTLVQQFVLPAASARVRDLVVDNDGNVQIYHGTFDPTQEELDPATGIVSQISVEGWTTANNISYGGIAALDDYVFVTDMGTAGDGAPKGIVRIDTSDLSAVRFSDTVDFIDLTLGHNGLLYGLTSTRRVYRFDPVSMTDFGYTTLNFNDHRGIAVDGSGNIFTSAWNGSIYQSDSEGTEIKALPTGVNNLTDIELRADGTLVAGSRMGTIVLADDSLAAVNSSFSTGSDVTFVAFTDLPQPTLTGDPQAYDATFSISEDAYEGQFVGQVIASDPAGDNLTFAITAGNEQGSFVIDDQGIITIWESWQLDYETQPSYSLTVRATDTDQNYSDATVTINLLNEDDTPPVVTAATLTLSEGQTIVIGASNLAATDPDTDDESLSFILQNVTNGSFQMGGVPTQFFYQHEINAGLVSFIHDDGEQPPSFDVYVSDDIFTSATVSSTVHFTNVNDNAPVIPPGQVHSVPEDAANGTVVGTVSFSDSDLPGDSLTANITGGDPNGIFAINNGGSLTVLDNTNLDHETTSSYSLAISVFDGVFTTNETVAVDVVDVNDVAPILTVNEIDILEGEALSIGSANLAATDEDSPDGALIFSVSSVSGGEFLVAGSPSTSFTQDQITTGDVTFVHDDSETSPSFDVAVSDGTLGTSPVAASVNFTNVNDQAPNISSGQSYAVSENAANGTTVGSVTFSDDDLPGDTLTATITGGNHDGVFAIDNGGLLTVFDNSNLDYESTVSYNLTISVFDGVHTADETIGIAVLNVNDVGPILTVNAIDILEGETLLIANTNLAATDIDSPDGSLIFNASNVSSGEFQVFGSPATSFSQDQISAGDVTFVHDDSETAPSFDVTVSDGTFVTTPAAASVTFTNVNDQAPFIPNGQTFSVSEAASNGTLIGTVTFSDADLPGDSLSIGIVSGDPQGTFSIDSVGNLTVLDASNLDYETTSSYTLGVQVSDGVFVTTEDVVVNVLDVLETKFFVADASADATFEYAADGSSVENYGLAGGNSTPRGATADSTGSTVWVVDNDDSIYLYDADGTPLGNWESSDSSRPQGIATDDNDIWIVDSRRDKVYHYLGGAAFTSGTHAADSSFSLNSANKNAKGITTDGVHLWILNDKNATEMVFKYTVSGSLVGSWTIDSASTRPEGITIDPTNVNDIWIVDRDTDQVFHYSGGAHWTSGSHSANSTFDLAGSNLNPRGIADPPPPQAVDSELQIAAAVDRIWNEARTTTERLMQRISASVETEDIARRIQTDPTLLGELTHDRRMSRSFFGTIRDADAASADLALEQLGDEGLV